MASTSVFTANANGNATTPRDSVTHPIPIGPQAHNKDVNYSTSHRDAHHDTCEKILLEQVGLF